MVFFQNWPIKSRLVLLSMLSSTIALLLACSAFVIHEQITAKTRLDRYYLALARVTGENCAAGLTFNEPDSVEQTLGSLRGESAIISATVLDRQGAFFAEFKREAGAGELPERHVPIWHRIMLDGELIGTLILIADMGSTAARLVRYLLIVGAVLAGSSLVAFFLSARLQRNISEPLVELAQIVT
ncbi:MAG TPA: CHASE sensor domain-containing protein, partial [Clostridia bacterium]|nr:CHASE sensor domain-containing protein [Clostridia bacterium]